MTFLLYFSLSLSLSLSLVVFYFFLFLFAVSAKKLWKKQESVNDLNVKVFPPVTVDYYSPSHSKSSEKRRQRRT
jgi:hypothetical protein